MGTAKRRATVTMAGSKAINEKTFTQSEVDTIVKDRLAREREKYQDYEELKAKAARLDDLEKAANR